MNVKFIYAGRSWPAIVVSLFVPAGVMYFCHRLVNGSNPLRWGRNIYPVARSAFRGKEWIAAEPRYILYSAIAAAALNLLLLIVIPAFWGGMDGKVKRIQWWVGCAAAFLVGTGISLFLREVFRLGDETFAKVIIPYIAAFWVTFIAGSFGVTRNYRKKFRFF